ncbi:MAG: CHASE2 domain-containing protein [Arenicella sp.]|nr:CHASE2 domain-containing protein [Arenicella sp.]
MKSDRWIILGYFGVLIICLLISYAPFVGFLDRQLLDKQFIALKQLVPQPVADDIVLIGIDEETFDYYREPLALWHGHLNTLFTGVAKAAPRGMLMDVILPERSYNFLGTDYDRQLLMGLLQLKKSTQMVTARTVDEQGRIRSIYAPILSVVTEQHTGLAIVESDSDGVVRKLVHKLVTDKGKFDTLVGKMSALLNYPAGDGYINYALGDTLDYVSMQQVDEWLNSGNTEAVRERFNQKVVFFGSVLPFADRHRVPVPMASWEPEELDVPGIFIHIQALRSVINDATVVEINRWWLLALLFLATLFWWLGYRLSVALWSLSLAALALLGASTLMLYQGVWLPVVAPLLAATFATTLRASAQGYLTWREKQLLRESFSGYVSPEVLKNIVEGEMHQGVGGESRQVCVLFSDIRDFTARSEGQDAHSIIDLLNRYFEEMTESVHSNFGTVDKFIGDGLMAFFGAPNDLSNPSENALSAAKEMLRRLEKLNRQLATEGIEEIKIGIGLHLGNAVIGHVGSSERHEYTAIGDAVNVAARLEGLSKQLGYTVVCSGQVRNELDDDLVDLGSQLLKGRSAMQVYGWHKA